MLIEGWYNIVSYQSMKAKTFELTAETAKGAEMAEWHSPALIQPAPPDAEACIDSTLQDTDQLPSRPDLDSWDSRLLTPSSPVWCYWWFFLSDYYIYWVIVDMD